MNTSEKIFLFSLIYIILTVIISSVNSSEDISQKDIRYLDDEIDDTLQNATTTIDKVDCKSNIRCEMSHMVCQNKNESGNCTCIDDYFPNFNNDTMEAKYCEIKQKKQLTAFLLELFVGFGAGHFYRHDYLMASLKLVAFFIGIYLICLFPLTAKCLSDYCDNDCCVIIASIIFYLYALGLAFWYIWDLVYFGKNKYKDCRFSDACIKMKKW